MGKCPDCGNKIGPMSILVGWDKWGKFICPGCGNQIQFRNWLFAVFVLVGLFIGAERVLHFMLISHVPLWLSFAVSFVTAISFMFIVPMIWTFEKTK